MSTADLLPLERVQIDHTRIDVVVVNEGDRLPIGRPWLTLAIDVASRVVLGFSVSLETVASRLCPRRCRLRLGRFRES
jgi:transposase InsO family protein